MPNRKKFNARFPPARIKKIMRTDKEVGKVAAPVPAVISRALELFAEQLLQQAGQVTVARGSRTLSPAHLKQCILAERRFDFLRELVLKVPDAAESEDAASTAARSPAGPSAAATPPPLPPSPAVAEAAAGDASLTGRATKSYLNTQRSVGPAAGANGQPRRSAAAPSGRPPVPDLIPTSLLSLSGGSVVSSFASGAPAVYGLGAAPPPGYPTSFYGSGGAEQPPPAHSSARPRLAVHYHSRPDGDRPDLV